MKSEPLITIKEFWQGIRWWGTYANHELAVLYDDWVPPTMQE